MGGISYVKLYKLKYKNVYKLITKITDIEWVNETPCKIAFVSMVTDGPFDSICSYTFVLIGLRK